VIARLVGTLVARDGIRGVLDVRDVGYAVHAAGRDLDAWAAAGGPVEVFVTTEVREDAITLYGFASDTARIAFDRLRQVDGVGPKIALAALDTLGLGGLAKAVAADDLTALAKVPGVGKKLAQRLALELKGKLPAELGGLTLEVVPPSRKTPADDQLELALARLGYTRTEIVKAQAGLAAEGVADDAPVAERLRASLRILSGGREAR
jgi:Holliday junction DNA helicase RuvA